MIDFNALFKISYGLYIVSSGDKDKGNGFISNTVFQVTAEPPMFAACCSKENYSCQMISERGCFTVSVLEQETDPGIIAKFGYQSGKNINKMDGVRVTYGECGAPIVMEGAIAIMECKLKQEIDLGTHIMFIAELIRAEILDEGADPLTYAWYRAVRKGMAPKNAPTYVDKSKLTGVAGSGKTPDKAADNKTVHKCSACGFVYDPDKEGQAFEDLPDDYTCPVCGADKEDFMEV